MTASKPAVEQEELLLTVPEAAARLRISRWSLYQLINQGALTSVKIGRRRLVPALALERYVQALAEGSVS